MKAGEDGIMFKDSLLRVAISKRIPSDLQNNFSDEIVTNSKKNKSISSHPLAIASSYFQDIKSELKSCTGTQLGTQKEFDNKIVDAQELLHRLGRDNTTTYKSRLTQKKLYKKNDAIFSIY